MTDILDANFVDGDITLISAALNVRDLRNGKMAHGIPRFFLCEDTTHRITIVSSKELFGYRQNKCNM
jgi:hypothetical protein